jgi:hypothetical protein
MIYTIQALAPDVLDRMRSDDPGLAVERVTAKGGGVEPLRCCLRDAEAGEALLLAGYEPPLPASPYAEKGAVFVHAEPCAGPDGTGYPEAWRGRPQVLRAYTSRGWIHPATRVHDGTDPDAVIGGILEHPTVVRIHSRNVAYGCYMFEVTRALDSQF